MKTSLNLVSDRSRHRNELRRCLRVWTRVFVVVVFLVTSAGMMQWYACNQKLAKQVSAEAEYEPVRELKLENARLKKEIANLQQAEIIPLKLTEHQPLLGLVGLTTKAVLSQQQRLFLNQIEIDREPLTLDFNAQPVLSVGLEGVAKDLDTAQQLVNYLKEAGPFESVDLTTHDLPAIDQQRQLAFSIECAN